jgi:dipeptidase D
MDGARGLASGALQGKTLINLDTEEWGHFYLGCAGGVDVEVNQSLALEALPPGYAIQRLEIAGLRGGHSGIDIHLGRGNAIKLLTEALRDLSGRFDLRLVEMQGGSARNALPREASALFALPAGEAAQLDDWIGQRLDNWQQRFAESDPKVSLACNPCATTSDQAIAQDARDNLIAFLDQAAYGVAHMSTDFADVVETSNNLGVASLAEGRFNADFLVRSLNDAGMNALADKLVSHAITHGMVAEKDGAYPGWTPNPDSSLLALCQRVYTRQFGQPANLQVIHAGLECGLMAASHPHLDMISFGPDIRGAHAPGERVEIASVGRCWDLLKSVLQALAQGL